MDRGVGWSVCGLDAGRPLLEAIGELMGFVSFFENFLQIAILLFAWIIVLLSFFILAIQLFVTLIEFKLATLAGFILVPFGLFGKTAFMAERVLGLVISSGVKVLVLAVIVGIGSTIFGEFTAGFTGEPTIEDAMAVVLAALSLLALGIFGPGIANGIVSGGPQLGAGAAVGTGLAAGGLAVGGALAGGMAVGAVGAGARGAASMAGGASTAYRLGSSAAGGGAPGVAAGIASVGKAGMSAAASPLSKAADGLKQSHADGSRAALTATGGRFSNTPGLAEPANDGPPVWAQRLRRQQAMHQGVSTAIHAVRSGDHGGGGTSISLSEKP